MTPEGKVKAAVKRVLKESGVWYYMPVQNGMGVVGVPDFICCCDGKFLAIETKAPGKVTTVTPNQQHQIETIRASGGTAFVTDTVEDVKLAIKYLTGDLKGVPP